MLYGRRELRDVRKNKKVTKVKRGKWRMHVIKSIGVYCPLVETNLQGVILYFKAVIYETGKIILFLLHLVINSIIMTTCTFDRKHV